MNPSVVRFITDKYFWVLRRKKDGCPLNVSYTIDGLKWTTNKLGRSLFYKDTIVTNGRILPKYGEYVEASDVYYEHFAPKEHSSRTLQMAELRWLDKAMKMCY